jgi:hypothetical protein
VLLSEYSHEQDISNYKSWIEANKSLESFLYPFEDYLMDFDLPLCRYTVPDWESCFQKMNVATNNISPVKRRIKQFLLGNNYPENVVHNLENAKQCGGTNYFLNVEQVRNAFNDYRKSKIGTSILTLYGYDVLTPVELGVYLIWMGFNPSEIIQIKRSDINISKGIVLFNDKTAKIPEVVKEYFEKYYDASGYWWENGRSDHLQWVEYNREGNVFLCQRRGSYKEESLIRLINNAGFSIAHLWRSGKLYNAWGRVNVLGSKALDWNNYESIGLFFDFGSSYAVTTLLQALTLKYDWERYCLQQEDFLNNGNVNGGRKLRKTKK